MARQEESNKNSMHIPLGRAVIIGALLLGLHPAASYLQEWRQTQAEQHRQTTLQLIEVALGEREVGAQGFAGADTQKNELLRSEHGELTSRVQGMEEQLVELTDRVSKLTSRLISLAEAAQPEYERLSAENFSEQP